jgi:hypothetical protein
LRRTQRTIALVRAGFAVVAGAAIVAVLVSGEHNDDQYEVLGTDLVVTLWQALAVAGLVLAVVFIGAVGELVRASDRHRFDS